ncbi:AGE family epimerase/isomerase [Escherichia coli]
MGGKPVVRERVRWPIVEAMGTAYALYTVTGNRQYEPGIKHGGSTALST